jgi:hypothetical protein
MLDTDPTSSSRERFERSSAWNPAPSSWSRKPIADSRCPGTLVRWCPGTPVPRYAGAPVRRYAGTLVRQPAATTPSSSRKPIADSREPIAGSR